MMNINIKTNLFVMGLLIFTVSYCSGCSNKNKDAIWTQPPQIGWDKISKSDVNVEPNEYKLFTPAGSQGRFPATIAVSRISGFEETTHTVLTSNKPDVAIPEVPRNEYLQWNRAFDELMAISSVFPVLQRDLGGMKATPSQIIAASKALRADLSLVYARNWVKENSSEMIGVIYETQSGRPIAAIRAQADSKPIPEDADDDEFDPFDYDSRAIVSRKFESLTFDCIKRLISKDQPQRIDIPAGWLPPQQSGPEWPPRNGS